MRLVLITLVYATGGRLLLIDAWVVDIARSVVTPSDTRAGTCVDSKNFISILQMVL